MIKSTIVAALLALAIPCAVKAEAVNVEGHDNYQVSCNDGSNCNDFNVTYEEANEDVAQTRRTRRSRSSSSSIEPFQNWYVGGGAGIFFADNLDTGFQGNIFAGTKFNKYVGADLEFTFGFADFEDFDENVTLLGFFLNPRFEYQFENSSITGFFSPGIGFTRASAFDDSDTEFDFQLKAGVSVPCE